MNPFPPISAGVQQGANSGAMPRGAEVQRPYIGGAPACTNTTPNGAEAEKPELIRILLGKTASDLLTATGERAFAIVHRAMRGTDEPETAGRWQITLAPVEWQTAADASAVLLGTKKGTTPRKQPVTRAGGAK